MIFILNILWFVLGGFIAGLAWILAGIIMAITIIGLPFVPTCFRLARYTFWPFGYDIVSRDQLTVNQISAQELSARLAMSSGLSLQAGGWL